MPFDYSFEALGSHLKICTTPAHKFGTDAFLLSDFAAVRKTDIACDLGSGCGIIPLLWLRTPEAAPQTIYTVEIQDQAVEQLQITKQENPKELMDRLRIVHADLKDLRGKLPFWAFDLVSCNPPYQQKGGGILNETQADQIARHEMLCSIDDVCLAAKNLLKYGGRFCLCQRPQRLADVIDSMRRHDLEPKRLRFVQQREHSAPWLFLIEGKRGSKPFMQVQAPLIVEGPGGFSQEMLRIYQKARNLPRGEEGM